MEEKNKSIIFKSSNIINNFEFKDSNIEEVIISSSISKIEPEAFKNAKKLKKVVIPNSVVEIGSDAFFGC